MPNSSYFVGGQNINEFLLARVVFLFKMRSLCVLFVVGLLVQLHMTSAGFRGGPDLTRFFSLEASSTCGDTPPSGSGDLGIVSCFPGERNASFVLDEDLESWWQSEDRESPVELTFSLQNVRCA